MLTIELIPVTARCKNLRYSLSPNQWDKIRRAAYSRAQYSCEICGGRGPNYPVECHEIWEFNDSEHTIHLRGFQVLCPKCHGIKYMTRSWRDPQWRLMAFDHLDQVNNWSRFDTIAHFDQAVHLWCERNNYQWKLDLSELQ